MTIGCPPDIFHCIGQVLEAAKSHLAGSCSATDVKGVLDSAETFLRSWDPGTAVYPTNDKAWGLLATAFRHACLLRIMRWPDTFSIPCDDDRIKASVSAILDACAAVPKTSPCHKRLLFPLFLAAADTSSPHQKHYVEMAIGQIKESTGFPHHAMTELLERVWEEREANTQGWINVPWMEFVSLAIGNPRSTANGSVDLLCSSRGQPTCVPFLLVSGAIRRASCSFPSGNQTHSAYSFIAIPG